MKRLICYFKDHKFDQEDAFLASFEAQLMNKNVTIHCTRCNRGFLVDAKELFKKKYEQVEMLN